MNNIYTIILCFKLLLCNPSFSTVDEIVSIIDTINVTIILRMTTCYVQTDAVTFTRKHRACGPYEVIPHTTLNVNKVQVSKIKFEIKLKIPTVVESREMLRGNKTVTQYYT